MLLQLFHTCNDLKRWAIVTHFQSSSFNEEVVLLPSSERLPYGIFSPEKVSTLGPITLLLNSPGWKDRKAWGLWSSGMHITICIFKACFISLRENRFQNVIADLLEVIEEGDRNYSFSKFVSWQQAMRQIRKDMNRTLKQKESHCFLRKCVMYENAEQDVFIDSGSCQNF